MLLGFGYLHKLFMSHRIKKLCDIIFLFLFKIESVGPVDQQINLVLPKACYLSIHLYFYSELLQDSIMKSLFTFSILGVVIVIVNVFQLYLAIGLSF